MEGLRWLGMDWDEGPGVDGPYGPYFQSQRLDIYQYYARKLVEEGHAYYCYCSEERLERLREAQRAAKVPPGYDRRCRNLTPAERAAEEAKGITPVVRLAIPLEGTTSYDDKIYGHITVENRTLEDLVLLKSDGYPTYHLANVVDDHLMEITHIMRGNEWLPSVPKHVLIYKAFGWEPPVYAHLPLLLGPDRSKLSKRHGALSVLGYRDQGYLVEAVRNFLALLGWAYDDKTEIFSLEQLIEYFTLDKVSPSPSIFDVNKLDWLNGYYIRSLPIHDLTRRALPFLEKELQGRISREEIERLATQFMPLVQERIKKLTDIWPLVDFFFSDTITYDPQTLVGKGMTAENTREALVAAREHVAALPEFTSPAIEADLRALGDRLGLKPASFFGSLRVAVTGKTISPPLFETMAILGRETVLRRLDAALAALAREPVGHG